MTLILNIFLLIILIFFLLDFNYLFEIKNQGLKTFIYYGFLIISPITFIWNFFTIKITHLKFINLIIPVLCLIIILFLNPITIFFQSSSWKTQKIIYKHGHLNFKRIEFQVQDKGALGYNKRTIEVTYLTKIFMITNSVEKDIKNKSEWIKIDKEINELKLK